MRQAESSRDTVQRQTEKLLVWSTADSEAHPSVCSHARWPITILTDHGQLQLLILLM